MMAWNGGSRIRVDGTSRFKSNAKVVTESVIHTCTCSIKQKSIRRPTKVQMLSSPEHELA